MVVLAGLPVPLMPDSVWVVVLILCIVGLGLYFTHRT